MSTYGSEKENKLQDFKIYVEKSEGSTLQLTHIIISDNVYFELCLVLLRRYADSVLSDRQSATQTDSRQP